MKSPRWLSVIVVSHSFGQWTASTPLANVAPCLFVIAHHGDTGDFNSWLVVMHFSYWELGFWLRCVQRMKSFPVCPIFGNNYVFLLLVHFCPLRCVSCSLVDVIELTVLNELLSRPSVDFKCPETAINSCLIKAESFGGGGQSFSGRSYQQCTVRPWNYWFLTTHTHTELA